MEDIIQGDEAIGNENSEPDHPRPMAVEYGRPEEMECIASRSTHLPSIAAISIEDNVEGDEAIESPEPFQQRLIDAEHGSDEEMQSIASRSTRLPLIEVNFEDDAELGSRWLTAAEHGRYQEIQLIARRMGPDRLDTRLLEMRDSEGKTALHLAAEHGHGDILRYLLAQGASVSAQDIEKRTPFILAAECGKSRLLQCLRDRGADINARDGTGDTAFLRAAFNGCLDTLKEIFEREEETAIGRAALLESRNFDGRTAFLIAARYGKLTALKYLLDRGSNTTYHDKNQDSALDLAIKSENLAIVKLLVFNDIDITSRDVDGQNALHRACTAGRTDIVEALLDRPLNIIKKVFRRLQREMITAQDAWGKTPLEVAASEAVDNDLALVLQLLRTEVHSPRDPANFEPYLSPESETEPIIELLSTWIKARKPGGSEPGGSEPDGIEPTNSKNRAAVTFFAISNGLLTLLDLCLEHWDILDMGREGELWVNVAALSGNIRVMEKVLETTGYTYRADDNNIIPLHLAAKHGHKVLLDFLLGRFSLEQREPESGSIFIMNAILKNTTLRMDVPEEYLEEGGSNEKGAILKENLISLAAAGGTERHQQTKQWLWISLSANIKKYARYFSQSSVNLQVFLELVTRFEAPDIVNTLGPVLTKLRQPVFEIAGITPQLNPGGSDTPGLTALYLAIALRLPTVVFYFFSSRGYITAGESLQCHGILNSPSTRDVALRESLGYKMIKDILNNPPSVLNPQAQIVDRTPKSEFLPAHCIHRTRGEIVDFWNSREEPLEFRVNRRSITDIVHTKGPEMIMKSIKYADVDDVENHIDGGKPPDKTTPRKHDIRWIHIPMNKVEHIESLVKKIFENKKPRSLSTFVRKSATEVLAGGNKRYMKPKCVLMRTPNPAASSDAPDVEAGDVALKAHADRQGSDSIRKVALFMPFIFWTTWSKESAKEDLQTTNPSHEFMTLDQFYHVSLNNTSERDKDQVLWRFSKKSHPVTNEVSAEILIVNQLCMWILDDNTIITSTTAAPVGVESVFFDRVVAALRAQEHVSSVTIHLLMHLILSTATGLFRKQDITVAGGKVSPLSVFRHSIVKVATQETRLFDAFEESLKKKDQGSAPQSKDWFKAWRKRQNNRDQRNEEHDPNPHLEIVKETSLLKEVKDIHEELNMLKKVVEDQQTVWRQALQPENDYGGISDDFNPSEIRAEIEEMIQQTETVKQSLSTLLDLKQKQANIFEAEYTRKQSEDTAIQGDTVMVFTVVTILFLPASFLTSLFALNVSDFPHEDGNVSYQGWWIFPIIFGVSIAVSGFFVVVAFNARALKRFGA